MMEFKKKKMENCVSVEKKITKMNASGESGGTMATTGEYETGGCSGPEEDSGSTMEPWEAAAASLILGFLVLATVLGNVLVILSVFTYRPLRIVQNFFIVSLAVADLAVALLVEPYVKLYTSNFFQLTISII